MADEPTAAQQAEGDLAKQLLEEVRLGNEKIVEKMAAIPLPVAIPSAVNPEDPMVKVRADQDAYQGRISEATDKYNELCSDGKYGEGLKVVLAAVATQPVTANADDHSSRPEYIALMEGARERAERKSADIFQKYGDEVDEEIGKLPLNERMTAAGVNKAVAAVKSAHIDDIVADLAKEQAAQAISNAQNASPQNIPMPSLGETDETDLCGLDIADRRLARSLHVSNQELSSQFAAGGERSDDDTAGTRINKDGTVDILPPIAEFGTIEPGKF
ncbi:MAG: hypothetical protein V3S43_06290 [Acidimicrobiia bacterium]